MNRISPGEFRSCWTIRILWMNAEKSCTILRVMKINSANNAKDFSPSTYPFCIQFMYQNFIHRRLYREENFVRMFEIKKIEKSNLVYSKLYK